MVKNSVTYFMDRHYSDRLLISRQGEDGLDGMDSARVVLKSWLRSWFIRES